MKPLRIPLAVLCLAFASSPAFARINMLEPWAPGMSFSIPKDTWNHDAHVRMGLGQHNNDLYELGYLLTTPVSPEWEVGGGLNYLSVKTTGNSESGFGDIPLGAKYKLPGGRLPSSLELIGEAGLTLPTGDPDKGLGAGGFGLFFGGALQGALAPEVTVYSHLGFRVFTKGQDTDLGEVIEYTFGGKYRVNPEWFATVDVRGFNHGRDEYKGFKGEKYEEIYLAPGAVFRPAKSSAEFLGTVLLGLSSDAFDFGLHLAAKF